MPDLDPAKAVSFATPAELGQWLKKKHATETELVIRMFRKGSGIPSVTWDEVVIETLCWGWIDGVKKSLDETSYLQRISPRKARSNWSRRNTEHVERLIAEGRMQEPGMVHVRAAQADGRWENAYSASRDMEVPADFVAAVNRKPRAKKFYATLTKSSRYVIAYSLETAKKPETRARRFDKYMDMLLREEKPDFGFKRKSKA